MSCFVAFHYRSYGTFFLHKNRLHNIYRGFTHYKYYRAVKRESNSRFLCGKLREIIAFFIKKCYNEGYEISRLYLGFRWNFTG
ncbi:hypothetical protein B0179_05745 [Streptococcus mitis]|uniref:Uncharacterized protein n=1 Tax=Streptococcus mitis TaxID=28037 RepID=A0A1S9Z9R4_STRMT|nr:hypothetical protein B0179_05745 [Streptococcus mitis]